MREVLSVENMRLSDAATIASKVSSQELMMRAATGIFKHIDRKGSIAIVCGSGNNAGDGFAIACICVEENIACDLFLLSEKFSEDGRFYFEKALKTGKGTVKVHYPASFADDFGKLACKEAGGNVECVREESFDLDGYDTIIDCIFGTGFHGEVTGIYLDAIRAINASEAFVIAADINSGINGDSGRAEAVRCKSFEQSSDEENCTRSDKCGEMSEEYTCVKSQLTVSVGSLKPGHFLALAQDMIGEVVNEDIGIKPVNRPYGLLEESDVRSVLKPRLHSTHKGTYGYVALIGGSIRYSGAIRLAGMANHAMRSGAGVVKLAVPQSLVPIVAPQILESTVFPLDEKDGFIRFNESEIRELIQACSVVAVGVGIGDNDETVKLIKFLLKEYDGTLIIDADGLNALARFGIYSKISSSVDSLQSSSEICNDDVAGTIDIGQRRIAPKKVILTPHPKEFSRLSGLPIQEVLDNPCRFARDFAKANNAIVLLKGNTTVITDGEDVILSDRGCAGMATAGSGDVLTGVISALVASNSGRELLATAAAAYITGLAGEAAEKQIGAISLVAGDTARYIGEVIRNLTR